MWMGARPDLLPLWVVALAGCVATDAEPPAVRVFAAASAADAVREALAGCAEPKRPPAVVVAASSATLARQIAQGAPAELFLSASPRWMDHLESQQAIEADTRRNLLSNALVVVAPRGSLAPFALDDPSSLAARIGSGRLALGDPDHVPAGIYAREALTALGLWSSVESQLARAADVRGALALVERGETPLGLVYATDAAASDAVDVVAEVPPHTHAPVTYPLAVVRGQGKRASVRRAWSCLLEEPAARVFAQHGFRLPEHLPPLVLPPR